jgi:hypothetical protein
VIGHRRMSDRRRRRFRAIRPMGGAWRNRRLARHAAAEWQHGRVPCSAWIPLPPASGKRQRMPDDSPQGFAPAATSQAEIAVPPQAMWMLKRHSALRRVIDAGSAAQRRCLARCSKEARAAPERPREGR